ncbi:MAG: hypothetical protein IPL79_14960 [Myxococcales bacterium]|nr:hypothetical protein [Myxococcales bacterium]
MSMTLSQWRALAVVASCAAIVSGALAVALHQGWIGGPTGDSGSPQNSRVAAGPPATEHAATKDATTTPAGPQVMIMPYEPPPAQLLAPTQHDEMRGCRDQLAGVLFEVVRGTYTTYLDVPAFWAAAGVPPNEQTSAYLGSYLYAEDGGATSSLATGADQPVKPIRTGFEVGLYRLIKEHIVRGGAPLTPAQILHYSLASVREPNGRANIATAIVTAHNVVRAMARPDKWVGDLVDVRGQPCPDVNPNCGYDAATAGHYGHPPTDVMMPVFRDLIGASSVDAGVSFYQLRGGRAGLVDQAVLLAAFAPGSSAFAQLPAASTALHNGGSHYYYWIGAVGQIFLGASVTEMGNLVERVITKLPSDPWAGYVQGEHLLDGKHVAGCLQQMGNAPLPASGTLPVTIGVPHTATVSPATTVGSSGNGLRACPPAATTRERCPWTPADASVSECPAGWCWDGGFVGSLACKQPETPIGASRNDLNDVKCPAGTTSRSDPCSRVVVACDPVSVGASPTN